MALIKEFVAPNGVATSYHRICKLTQDFDNMRTQAVVYSYVSQDVRKGGSNLCVGDGKAHDLDGIGDRAWAYEQLKKDPAFADAADA